MKYLKKLEIKLTRGDYLKPKDKLSFPREIYKTFKTLKDKSQECLVGIYLNNDLEMTNYDILAIGSEDQALVPTKEIFTHALIMRADCIVLIHNHPSGNIEPSYEDREVISVIKDYSRILRIRFLDFIIIGDKGRRKSYWSYFEEEGERKYPPNALF
jgi:DNA repair protein RadC